MESDAPSIYQRLGGQEPFRRIASEFYSRVADDVTLRPLYPEHLEAAEDHLALFLIQFFGGPQNYSMQRGHPMLRARHLPFAIGRRERDAWVKNMLAALEAAEIEEPALTEMQEYFRRAATFLMNQVE